MSNNLPDTNLMVKLDHVLITGWYQIQFHNVVVTEITISNSPLSDHCTINLRLKNRDTNDTFKDYWKCNSLLLRNVE